MLKINTNAIKESSINTIAIGLTAAGAAALTAGKYYHGAILILAGVILEYIKYSWRFIYKKVK